MTRFWHIFDLIFICIFNPWTLMIVAIVGLIIEFHDEKENDDDDKRN